MFGLGIPELIVIFVIALLVFGPKKLPDLGKSIGRAMAEFKKASDDFQESVKSEMREVEKSADLDQIKKLGELDMNASSGAPANAGDAQSTAGQPEQQADQKKNGENEAHG
jgi:sec-independent protein translocase protein TatA